MRRLNAVLASLVVAALVGGCTHRMKTAVIDEEPEPYIQQGRIQFDSSSTSHFIEIVRADARRTSAGLLKVTLTVRNKKKDNFWTEVRTTYLDEHGHVLEQTNWEPIQLDARTVTEYSCTSMSDKAADYQVILRRPAKSSLKLP